MEKIYIRVDSSGIQSLTQTAKISFSGAYLCRNLTGVDRAILACDSPFENVATIDDVPDKAAHEMTIGALGPCFRYQKAASKSL
jgi:hypothetical protein